MFEIDCKKHSLKSNRSLEARPGRTKGNDGLPTIHFQVLLLSFKDPYIFGGFKDWLETTFTPFPLRCCGIGFLPRFPVGELRTCVSNLGHHAQDCLKETLVEVGI